jgi:hypothetical protein
MNRKTFLGTLVINLSGSIFSQVNAPVAKEPKVSLTFTLPNRLSTIRFLTRQGVSVASLS